MVFDILPGGGEIPITFTIIVPLWLVRVAIQPVLLYRWLRYGHAFSRIPLTRGQFAIVDPDDFLRLCTCKWFTVQGRSTFYAARWIYPEGKRREIYMHREVLETANDMVVDHINHNGLDNRKANLRPATSTENKRNQRRRPKRGASEYRGLRWDKNRKKWRAQICFDGRRLELGRFDDEIEAAKAYDRAAIEHHGEFASLNFPESAKNGTT